MSASAGRVLIIPKGDYDNTVEYKMLDLVSYSGSSYLCKQTTTGNLPTDTTYWQEMVSVDDMTGASAGAAGVHGLVPAPSAGSQAKFLRGDATWAELDLSSKADQSIIGGSYNASTAYEPGDRFSYNGVRYKVIIESGTVQGQTPPNATYYEVCSVDDDIVSLNNSLTVEGGVLYSSGSGNVFYRKTGRIVYLMVNGVSFQTANVLTLLTNNNLLPDEEINSMGMCYANSKFYPARVYFTDSTYLIHIILPDGTVISGNDAVLSLGVTYISKN